MPIPKKLPDHWAHFVDLIFIHFIYPAEAMFSNDLANSFPQRLTYYLN